MSQSDVISELFSAVISDDAEALERLLQLGGDPNAATSAAAGDIKGDIIGHCQRRRRRLLHAAVSPKCRPACLRLLLDSGADANLTDAADVDEGSSDGEVNDAEEDSGEAEEHLGETPLHAAAESCRLSGAPCVRALLSAGADCWIADDEGDNPLHRACLVGNAVAAAALLEAEPRLANCPTIGPGHGPLTCLHVAAAAGDAELFRLLLRSGADHLALDGRGRAPIDILLASRDTDCLDCLGRRLAACLRPGLRQGQEPLGLLSSRAGRRYLAQLLRIDTSAASGRETPFRPSDRVRQERLAGLEEVTRGPGVSAQRLVDALVDAHQLGLTPDLELPDCACLIGRLAGRVGRLVLLSQEAGQLRRLTACRRLWLALASRLRLRIRQLYSAGLRYRKATVSSASSVAAASASVVGGPCQAMRRELAAGSVDGRWRVEAGRLNRAVARLTGFTRFRRRESVFPHETNGVGVLRDPLQSLTTWAVLTGRLRLVAVLLRQEEFDLVPLALLSATLLRALSRRPEVDDVFTASALRVASVCETMAVRTLRAVNDVDSSLGNCLTIAFVSQPLPNYADYTVLDLAAIGSVTGLIKLDIVELATDMRWYGDFFDSSSLPGQSSLLRELLIVIGFVPPLVPLLPRLLRRLGDPERRRFLDHMIGDGDGDGGSSNEDDQGDSDGEDSAEVEKESELDKEVAEDLPAAATSTPSTGWRAELSISMADLRRFYDTPCVKFRASVVFYFTTVLMMSMMILHDFQGGVSKLEVASYVALLGVLAEELRELAACRQQGTLGSYLADGWNILDLIAITCGVLAFLARRFSSDQWDLLGTLMPDHERRTRNFSYLFVVAATLIFWMRVLFVSVVLESVGVKLKMLSLVIRRDFIPFLYILLVVMAGFGIAFAALLWPGAVYYSGGRRVAIPPFELLMNIIRRTFYAIVGEYSLDELGKVCDYSASSNETETLDGGDMCVAHPGSDLVHYGLLVVYIVITQILLMNVIVALFSKTVDSVDAESRSMWLIGRYELNEEFAGRSAIPLPFNLLMELWNLLNWLICQLLTCCGALRQNDATASAESAGQLAEQRWRSAVYAIYLFYQAATLRRLRPRLDGYSGGDEDGAELSGEAAALAKQLGEVSASQAGMLDELEAQSRELGVFARQLNWLIGGRHTAAVGVTKTEQQRS